MQNITVEAVKATALAREPKKQTISSFDEKNYLNVRLEPGVMKKELRIRLLPIDKDASTPFKIIHMHNVKVPTEVSKSGWKTYVCLNKTEDIDHEKLGKACPFCELRYEAYKKSTEVTDEVEKRAWQRLSLDNKPIDVCVIRCIERGHEEDGPKFWKFSLHSKKDDAYHQLQDLFETRRQEDIEDGGEGGNIFDLYNGKDLKITVTAVLSEGKWTNRTNVSVIDLGKSKPLSESEEEMEKWINDEKKWSDVFVAKPYDYLSLIIDQKVPYYDRAAGKWVAKNDPNADEQTAIEENESKIDTIEKAVVTEISETNVDSELPF